MNLLAYFKRRESWEEERDKKNLTPEMEARAYWLACEMYEEKEREDERSNRRTHTDRLVRYVPAGV